MPAKSKAQQEAMGMALAAKRGHIPVNNLKGSALQMYHSMSEQQLMDFVTTSRKGLPKKVSKKKKKKSN